MGTGRGGSPAASVYLKGKKRKKKASTWFDSPAGPVMKQLVLTFVYN